MPAHPTGDHTFALGALLGGVQHGQERLIYIAEMHGHSLSALVETQRTMAATLARLEARPTPGCPHPVSPAGERMTWKDKAQLAVFGAALIAAALGKVPWSDVLAVAGKPLGF